MRPQPRAVRPVGHQATGEDRRRARRSSELDGMPGTFGDGDAAAETIKFTLERRRRRSETDLRMTRVAGMIFNQKLGARPAGHLQGDRHGRQRAGRPGRRPRPRRATRSRPSPGVKVDLADEPGLEVRFRRRERQVPVGPRAGRPSTSRGPIRSTYQRDKNLDKRPIQLLIDPAAGKTETFPKGLTLNAKTMITYELKGQYKSFRAIAGVDADPENEAAEPGEDHDRRRRAG